MSKEKKSYPNLVAYWQASHIDGRIPSRADIDPPLHIPQLLPNLLLVDVLAEGFRMRLIGSEIARRIGHDNTGKILGLEVTANPLILAFMGFLKDVVRTSAPVYFSSGSSNVSKAKVNGVLLPLIDATGSISHILGGIFYDQDQIAGLGTWQRPSIFMEEPPPEF